MDADPEQDINNTKKSKGYNSRFILALGTSFIDATTVRLLSQIYLTEITLI